MVYQIKFGTDGWRAVIADGYTRKNLARVAQATADVLKKQNKSKLVVVGYDHRYMSPEFAHDVVAIMKGNGFKVELSDGPVTSPMLSFHTKSKRAAVGVMITASHNPPFFNGFKLKGVHGGSVDSAFTSQVEAEIDASDEVRDTSEPKTADFTSNYVKWIKKQVPHLSLNGIKGSIVFDAMYGPGGNVFDQIIGSSKKVHIIRRDRDPLFGGINPEPIEVNLAHLKKTVLEQKASIGIAVDGDADRIGIVDNKGNYIPPHTVMPLILQHLIENRRLKGKVVQTVSMGYLPGRIAASFKMPFEEVPVGFKHIALRINSERVLLGGEESGGYGVGLWSPERDGLLCALLLLEFMSKARKDLSDVIEMLYEKYGKSHFKRVDFQLKEPVDKPAWTEKIQGHIGAKINSYPVKEVRATDGIKVVLEDESWVLMRPSGTEPLIRTYSEGPSMKIVKDLLTEADRLVHIAPARSGRGKSKNAAKSTRKPAKTSKR